MNKVNVLLVEDIELQASHMAALLAKEGVGSEHVTTLYDAVRRLHDDGIDCVVLDLNLPDAGGMEALHTIQAGSPGIPIVVNTGYHDLWQEAIRSGAQDVLLKPLDGEDLAWCVQKAVIRHQVRRKFEPYQQALDSAAAKVSSQLRT